MATYFHGNSEIQAADGLQTLVLMNPAGYVQYSEAPPQAQSTANNFVFLNSVAAAAAANSYLPQAQQPHTQQFVGIPLPTMASAASQDPDSQSMNAHHEISALHGYVPRVQYNLWNSLEPNAAAREIPRAQQGLSLSLSSQQPGYGSFRAGREVPSQAQAPAISGEDMRISGGSSSSASGVTNGVSGMRSHVLLSSKYLKAAQELLDEVVNVGNGMKSEILRKANGRAKVMGESSAAESGDGSVGGEASGKRAAELSTAERQEIQMKKAKLLNMLDEVDQRYRQYHNQMQIVISTFEQAAGIGSARTYTALALQTISKQFRCLKDSITGQIRAANKSLGEEDSPGGKIEGSRLKYVDHQLRQQRALQQLGMIQHNAWRPQRGLPERSVSVLRAWLFDHFLHPYPKDSDKHLLAKQTGLTRGQVSNWFINARVRLWKPMVEEMYLEELKEQEQNGSEEKISKSNEDSASKSSAPQEKSPATENRTKSFNSKRENSTNQNAAPAFSVSKPSTSPVGGNVRNQSGFIELERETERESMEDFSKYTHSPVHLAVVRRDYAALRRIISTLPRLAKAGEVNTEEESLAAELQADAVSTVIDRRDVPGRETPLHLAVRLRDATSAEILMAAGADWSLQNENGWSALQEAVCTREESIALIIARHYQPLAWAKWCRRLPRIVASMARIRDFYMEITFHFESSVIPFIGRIAPSDTYRIWKRGSNLRADMTLAGFDGFRIQRSDQTFLFLGEGYSSEDGNVTLSPGSLIVLSHKEKEITNALEGAGTQPTEAEVAHEVALMSQTNMYRPGIDVTQAELVPHLNWRRLERTEMVGNWKAKVYDMLHVMVSVKSRRVPGAMTDEELFAVDDEERLANGDNNDDYDDVLTAEERMQLDSALRMGNSDGLCEDEEHGIVEYQENGSVGFHENGESNGAKEKKSWFGWNKKGSKSIVEDPEDSKILKKFSKLAPEGSNQKPVDHQKPSSEFGKEDMGDAKKGKDKSSKKKKKKGATSESKLESEYKKGLRPVLWLTPDFSLKTDELLPLLDILANKVKAVRRLRELLTTKLPPGTFPVKIAIPIVPTIRVLVTFTKFEELQPSEEFSTPLSSPAHFQDAKSKESEGSTSWISWMRGSRGGQSSDSDSHRYKDEVDPFQIPSDYTWVDANEKKRRLKAKKAKSKKNRKHAAARGGDGGHQVSEDVEE